MTRVGRVWLPRVSHQRRPGSVRCVRAALTVRAASSGGVQYAGGVAPAQQRLPGQLDGSSDCPPEHASPSFTLPSAAGAAAAAAGPASTAEERRRADRLLARRLGLRVPQTDGLDDTSDSDDDVEDDVEDDIDDDDDDIGNDEDEEDQEGQEEVRVDWRGPARRGKRDERRLGRGWVSGTRTGDGGQGEQAWARLGGVTCRVPGNGRLVIRVGHFCNLFFENCSPGNF